MTAQMEMPKYNCHKQVWALRISAVVLNENGSGDLFFVEEGYSPISVDESYMNKHKPTEGGYYVVYADGYKSFSPAEAFKAGYSPA